MDRKVLTRFDHYTKTYRQSVVAREGKSIHSRYGPLDVLANPKRSLLHTYIRNINSLRNVYLYIIYRYIQYIYLILICYIKE